MKESEAYRLRDSHANRVREVCTVKAEWEDFNGWLDGFQAKFFVIRTDGDLIVLKVNEAGAFRQPGGGWAKFRILKPR